jgi:hypothetical protein
MTNALSFTTEEWTALLGILDLPEPFGLPSVAAVSDGMKNVGARSLLGRGMLLSGDTAEPHPDVTTLLVAVLDAQEVVQVSTAHARGYLMTYSWFAMGDTGVSASLDPLGNYRFLIGPVDEVAEQAKGSLSGLRADPPAPQQYPVETAALGAALQVLVEGTGIPTLAGVQAGVEIVGSVHGWVSDEEQVTEDEVVVVGLVDRGLWVVDADGESPLLTQQARPWPDLLTLFAPS